MQARGIVLIFLGLVAICVFVLIAADAVLHTTSRGKHGATLLKLSQLETAADSYEVRYGDRFPHGGRRQIENHFHKIAPWMETPIALLETNGRSVETLDESEALVLFLGGEMQRLFEGMTPEFVFPIDQLVDRDNDGWKEYISRDGDLYTIDGGHVALRNIATGELTQLSGQPNE